MRRPLSTANLLLAVVLGASVTGCTPPLRQPTPAQPPALPATALGGDLVASTNEPFWQAQVAGQTLTLRGIESERALMISSSRIAGATRTVKAADARGLLELQVIDAPCQDSMSGARFPYRAVLILDGETFNGCARPASMPQPGEVDESVPDGIPAASA